MREARALAALPPTPSETQTVTPAAEAPAPAPVEDEGPGLIENVAALGESVGERRSSCGKKRSVIVELARLLRGRRRAHQEGRADRRCLGLAPAEEEAEALAEAAEAAEAPAASTRSAQGSARAAAATCLVAASINNRRPRAVSAPRQVRS